MSRSGSTDYLVHGASCTQCSEIAHSVQRLSEGRLIAISAGDPVLVPARTAGHDVDLNEPFILSARRDGTFRVRRGVAMSLWVLRQLGAQRSLAIARILGGGPEVESHGRRRFLLGTIGTSLSVAGLLVGVQPASAASGRRMGGADQAKFQARAGADAHHQSNVLAAARAGFDESSAIHQAAEFHGEKILLTVLASRTRPEDEAAILMYRQIRSGVGESFYGISRRESFTASQVTAYGPKAFVACVIGLSGGRCAAAIAFCANLRFWQLILPCLVGKCGPEVVRAAWQCKRLL